MKINYLKLIFFVIVLTVMIYIPTAILAKNAGAEKKPSDTLYMEDPLFGISYQTNKIHFENAPNVIFKCTDLRIPKRKLYLFGRVNDGKIAFYFVYGLIEVDQDGSSNRNMHYDLQDGQGLIVVIKPNGCNSIDAGFAWSSSEKARQMAEKLGITSDVADRLLDDAFDRIVSAFGGPTKFLERLDASYKNNPCLESTLLPQIEAKLAALRKKELQKKSP